MATIPINENATLVAIEAAVLDKRDDWRRIHLGASVIGQKCNRAIWYGFRWCKAPEFSARQLRLFARGQREEDVFVSLLRDAGVTVVTHDENTGEQYRVSAIGGHFGGSLDGACLGLVESPKTWHVTEFKTHNAKSFKDLQAKGVQASKPLHYSQMQVYMHHTGMARAYYMAVCKDDDQLYAERVHYDKAHAIATMQRAESIIKLPEPPIGISTDPSWYECKWCDYQGICHGDTLPEINCRTCLHSTPLLSGGWHCESAAQMGEPSMLGVDEQKSGCDWHLFIPALVQGTPIDADENGGWVEYERNGKRFKNIMGGSWQ